MQKGILKNGGPKSPSKSQDFNDVIPVVRALVNSRKQLSNVRDVDNEYKEMQGEAIPYKKFGYSTLEQYLNASGEFYIKNNGGEVKRNATAVVLWSYFLCSHHSFLHFQTIISLKLAKTDDQITTRNQNPAKVLICKSHFHFPL